MPIDQGWLELVERVTKLETQMTRLLDNELPHLVDQLTRIEERVSKPPWGIVMVVSLLSSTVVGLLVALVK